MKRNFVKLSKKFNWTTRLHRHHRPGNPLRNHIPKWSLQNLNGQFFWESAPAFILIFEIHTQEVNNTGLEFKNIPGSHGRLLDYNEPNSPSIHFSWLCCLMSLSTFLPSFPLFQLVLYLMRIIYPVWNVIVHMVTGWLGWHLEVLAGTTHCTCCTYYIYLLYL